MECGAQMENNNSASEEQENENSLKRSIDEVEDCATNSSEKKIDVKLESAAEISVSSVEQAKCPSEMEINETTESKDAESKIEWESEKSIKRSIDEVEDCATNPSEKKMDLKLESAYTAETSVSSVEQVKCPSEVIETRESKDAESKIDYRRKRKCVLLLSYCGKGYNGMQRNPGVRTIEEDLTNALLKARAISEDASRNYSIMSFQRCARTDKGVSAARQVVSLKMVPYKELIPEINKHLEPQIRVFALKQVTRGFDCKSRCSSRTYKYILPTFAFAPSYAHTTKYFRMTDEILEELNLVLKTYEGTKNFHNFTSGKDFKEESAKRYIIQFNVDGTPLVEGDMEFLVLKVQGQSFMQHQIRKMIGLVIAIMKKFTDVGALQRAFLQPKFFYRWTFQELLALGLF
ncbi:tRNA pseudouridine synthase A-like isoform X2 [Dendronephthya gigantea]|uniref:tRNA pseudouridine synthase A-like isoform X2 n=1 Tax=Dendronephthya gigantea TaxID=151771 RepID=UPI00106B95C7|nr:tRNA pseudouridine synthase A-like isoform X2 [Dendronephthya gigantea]